MVNENKQIRSWLKIRPNRNPRHTPSFKNNWLKSWKHHRQSSYSFGLFFRSVKSLVICSLYSQRPELQVLARKGESIHNPVLTLGASPCRYGIKKVKRTQDEDIQSNILEIVGTNVQSTYITCPSDPSATLSIKLPFLVMIVKNLKKYFTFEIQILDDKNVRRRFRASNFQSMTRVKPFICTMPLRMDEGWNQIQLNLGDLTRRAYGTNYVETLRVQVHANCRLRRIYFSDRLYSEEQLPPEFKLYLPMQQKQ
ncbi:hypothetical protein LXL04_034267 [Taraxacum kok-saghyz]